MKIVQVNGALGFVDLRDGLDVGEIIAAVAVLAGQQGPHRIDPGLGILLSGLEGQQRAQLFITVQRRAQKADLAKPVLLALTDADLNKDFFLVGGQVELGAVDGEIHIALVQVQRAQALQTGGQPLPGIAVIPGQD